MNDENEIKIDDITIDLGSDHISGGSGVDTITLNTGWDSIGTIDMSIYNSNYNTYTLPGSVTSGSTYTISNGTWNTPYITTSTNSASISVEGDAEFKGNIKVKGKDLSEWMETLERRLAILVPDPKKLEQYEALQKAYKHYKMLEALCEERNDDEESK